MEKLEKAEKAGERESARERESGQQKRLAYSCHRMERKRKETPSGETNEKLVSDVSDRRRVLSTLVPLYILVVYY